MTVISHYKLTTDASIAKKKRHNKNHTSQIFFCQITNKPSKTLQQLVFSSNNCILSNRYYVEATAPYIQACIGNVVVKYSRYLDQGLSYIINFQGEGSLLRSRNQRYYMASMYSTRPSSCSNSIFFRKR